VKPTPLAYKVDVGATSELKFPKGFIHRVTSAALQIEGATKSEDRGPSVFEDYAAKPLNSTQPRVGPPDISTLNYYMYKQEIARLAAVGIKATALAFHGRGFYRLALLDRQLISRL
jgi:hypothetical protein